MDEFRVDAELPNKMAHLDIMEVDDISSVSGPSQSQSPDQTLRVLRKRKSLVPEINKTRNRRVSMKPRKHNMTDNSKKIEAVYLNNKVKASFQTLETIYEEPKTDSDNPAETLIGGRKVKRLLTFHTGHHYTKEKIKKRRAKIKKMLGNKSFLNRKKIPMQVFLKTIECLELDETVQCETKILHKET
ncbi:hypothetical protein ACJJTC_006580 [Scirpophaga incertulas]